MHVALKSRASLEATKETTMPESKNDFRKALGSVIEARSREATRQVNYRFQHQLIGAITKRPN